jgi:hypothetical protein
MNIMALVVYFLFDFGICFVDLQNEGTIFFFRPLHLI